MKYSMYNYKCKVRNKNIRRYNRMGKIKKFIGEYAYKCIKNMAYNTDALRNSLVTPANARAVFSELTEYEIKSLVQILVTAEQ